MKKRTRVKLKSLFLRVSIILFLFSSIAATGYYFLSSPEPGSGKPALVVSTSEFGWKFPVAKLPSTGPNGTLLAYSSIRDPGGVPQGLPVRLRIPSIGVDTAIEDALITPDGRMDVPEGSVNVAWFALGPYPGKEGSAVIGGHFGIDNGVPKVFFNLNKLKVGDKIHIIDDGDQTLVFEVRRTQSFDRNADATTVFTSDDGLAHLNLITCEGVWNQVNDSYPQRLVIFTDSVPSDSAPLKPGFPSTAVPPAHPPAPTLPSPTPIVAITPTSSNPVINEKTATSTDSRNTPTFSQKFVPYIKSLYGSPQEGVFTSLLLLAIAFIIFKIIRR